MKTHLVLNFAILFFAAITYAQRPPVIPIAYRSVICARSCSGNMGKTTFAELTSSGASRCPARPQVTYSCAPYLCDSQGRTCRTDCIDNRDCSPGFRCNPQIKTCFTVSYFCANHISLNGTDGSFRNCSPYKCDMGTCLSYCKSEDECAAGSSCHSDGHCGP